MHHRMGNCRTNAFRPFPSSVGRQQTEISTNLLGNSNVRDAPQLYIHASDALPQTGDGSQTKAQKYWKKLSKELEDRYSFRNNLAHQPTTKDKIEYDDESISSITWVTEMIIPNSLDMKKVFQPIVHSGLEAHLKAVSLIGRDLSHFTLRLPRLEEAARETFYDIEDDG